MNLNELAKIVHQVQRQNGWWDERDYITKECKDVGDAYVKIAVLGLAATEISEAIEAVRKRRYGMEKDSFAREIGGAMVRLLDLAAGFGVDLDQAVRLEMDACIERGRKHGGKAA